MDSDDVGVEDIDRFKKVVKQARSGPQAQDELLSLFAKIKEFCSPDVVSSTQAVYQFNIAEHGEWFLDLKTGSGNLKYAYFFIN